MAYDDKDNWSWQEYKSFSKKAKVITAKDPEKKAPEKKETLHKVFIYGITRIDKEGTPLENVKAIERDMIISPNYFLGTWKGYPVVCEYSKAESTQFTVGDLYQVTDEQLKALDKYETWKGLLERKEVKIPYQPGPIWAYIYPKDNDNQLQLRDKNFRISAADKDYRIMFHKVVEAKEEGLLYE